MTKFIEKIDKISKREPVVSVADQECAEIAHVRRKRIIKLKRDVERNFLAMGKELYNADKDEDWRFLGFSSMREYCDAPEESGGVSYSLGHANKLKNVYKKYIIDIGVSSMKQLEDVGIAKLYDMKEVINEDNTDEWLGKARTSSTKDLKKEIEDKGCLLSQVPEFVDVIISIINNMLDCFKRTYNYKEVDELDTDGGCKGCPKLRYCRIIAEAVNEFVANYRKQKGKKKVVK